jgi:DhnA family fructose-bisphosphate aldolase class Ia
MDFVRDDGKCVIIAMDHGASMGVIDGLKNAEGAIRSMSEADGIILTYGTARRYSDLLREARMPFILRCDNLTSLMPTKPSEIDGYCLIADLDEVQRLGASGVMLYLVLGMNSTEASVKNIETVAGFADACEEAGLPLFVETVLWGRNFIREEQNDVRYVRHACRIASELGADIIRAPYTGSVESFAEVIGSSYVPVTIMGGDRTDAGSTLQDVRDAMDAGASGAVLGKSVWQDRETSKMLKAVLRIVHENASVDEALSAADLR